MARALHRRACIFVLGLTTIVLAPALAPAQAIPFEYTAENFGIAYQATTGVGVDAVSFFIREPANPGSPHQVGGWGMSVQNDPTEIQPTQIEPGSYLASINGGAGPDFFDPTLGPDGFHVAVVYSFVGTTDCTYEVAKEVLVLIYETVPATWIGNTIGGTSTLVWAPLGTPPTQNVVVVLGASYPATTAPRVLDLIPVVGDPVMLRGDANSDGAVIPVADAVFMLAALFSGGTTPVCLDSADIGGDGAFDIADPVAMLSYGFSGGPPPVPPFPVCGFFTLVLGCDATSCP